MGRRGTRGHGLGPTLTRSHSVDDAFRTDQYGSPRTETTSQGLGAHGEFGAYVPVTTSLNFGVLVFGSGTRRTYSFENSIDSTVKSSGREIGFGGFQFLGSLRF